LNKDLIEMAHSLGYMIIDDTYYNLEDFDVHELSPGYYFEKRKP